MKRDRVVHRPKRGRVYIYLEIGWIRGDISGDDSWACNTITYIAIYIAICLILMGREVVIRMGLGKS